MCLFCFINATTTSSDCAAHTAEPAGAAWCVRVCVSQFTRTPYDDVVSKVKPTNVKAGSD